MTAPVSSRGVAAPGASPWYTLLFVAGVGLVALGGSVVYVFLVSPMLEARGRPEGQRETGEVVMGGMMSTPLVTPAIDRPPTVPAAKAKVADNVEVVGVSAGGQDRAYLVNALAPYATPGTVINDLLGDVPITVTFSGIGNKIMVFTSPDRGHSLRVMIGGRVRDKMLLFSDDGAFYQENGISPQADPRDAEQKPVYPIHPFERTTWKTWKTAHPKTELYEGTDPALTTDAGREKSVRGGPRASESKK